MMNLIALFCSIFHALRHDCFTALIYKRALQIFRIPSTTLAKNDILKKVFRNYLHNKNLKIKFCNKPIELLKFFLIWDIATLNIVEHAIKDCEIIWGLIQDANAA